MRKNFALAFFILLSYIVFAESVEVGLKNKVLEFYDDTLEVYGVEKEIVLNFSNSPEEATIKMGVRNRLNETIRVYIASEKEGKMTVDFDVLTLNPFESKEFFLNLDFVYRGSSIGRKRYALFAETSSKPIGKILYIKENWVGYENGLYERLVGIEFQLIPLILLLGILILLVVHSAYSITDAGIMAGEYTLRTLFFPMMRDRPLLEKIADIMLHPFFWTLELIGGLTVITIFFVYALISFGVKLGSIIFIVAGAYAIIVPLVYFSLAWVVEYMEHKPLRFLFAMFMWGIFASFVAFIVNSGMAFMLSFILGQNAIVPLILSTVLIAPVVEEIAKGFGVIVAAGHHEMNDLFDGIMYGFCCGVGFALVENWYYFTSDILTTAGVVSWLNIVLYRSFLNTLAHGWMTAFVGALLGFAKQVWKNHPYYFVLILPALLVAVILHMLLNVGAIADGHLVRSGIAPLFIVNPSIIVLLTFVFFLLIIYGVKHKMQKVVV